MGKCGMGADSGARIKLKAGIRVELSLSNPEYLRGRSLTARGPHRDR